MIINLARTSFLLLVCCAAAPLSLAMADEDLDAIKYGEAALSYASGSIVKTSPQDGVVNVVTGDNQTSGDRMQLGQRDTLYLKLKHPGEASVGDLFTVFKRSRKVFHPATGEYLGYLVIRVAIVEVTQVDKALTTVKAVRAYGAIAPGDPVVRFAVPVEPESAPSSTLEDVKGMIVEFQSDMGVTLVAQRNLVYVDRGRADGVRGGDILEVFRTGGSLPPRVVGEIKVLFAEEKTASALVTKSSARLLKGDRIRVKMSGPEAVPVSRPIGQFQEPTRSVESAPRITQNASRETKITLNDLMKQLQFESGEATIRPEGYQVLDGLISQLKDAPGDQLIRVEGHADNMEIGPSLKSRYPTNWDLSKARASGVLRYLVEKGGIDSARISSVGYGDTKPVVSNATEVGRQRNRRVEVVLYAPESENELPEQAMTSGAAGGHKQLGELTAAEEGLATRLQSSSGKTAVEEPLPVPGERDAAKTAENSGIAPGTDQPPDPSAAPQR